MSDDFTFLLVIAALLGLLYAWLRGWWFAGVIVALTTVALTYKAWAWGSVWAGLLGFAPWAAWKSFTPAGRRLWADIAADPKQVRAKREAADREAYFRSLGFKSLPGTGLSPETIKALRRQGVIT